MTCPRSPRREWRGWESGPGLTRLLHHLTASVSAPGQEPAPQLTCSPAHRPPPGGCQLAEGLHTGRTPAMWRFAHCTPPPPPLPPSPPHTARAARGKTKGANQALGCGRQREPLGPAQTRGLAPGRRQLPDAESQAQSPLSLCLRCKYPLPAVVPGPARSAWAPGEWWGGPSGCLRLPGPGVAGGFEHELQRGHLCGTGDRCQRVSCPWGPDTGD